MVTLYNPLLHNGRIIPAGSSVMLPELLEKRIIEEGNGCVFQEVTPDPINTDHFNQEDPPVKEIHVAFEGDAIEAVGPTAVESGATPEDNAVWVADPEETLGRVGRET